MNTISKPQTGGVFELSKPSANGGAAAQNAGLAPDRIDIGGQNDLLAQAQNAGDGDRAARVEQLRALVQTGQYQVDSNALSESIVSAALNGY